MRVLPLLIGTILPAAIAIYLSKTDDEEYLCINGPEDISYEDTFPETAENIIARASNQNSAPEENFSRHTKAQIKLTSLGWGTLPYWHPTDPSTCASITKESAAVFRGLSEDDQQKTLETIYKSWSAENDYPSSNI